MIGRETRMLLRHYLEQGASKSALLVSSGSAGTQFTDGFEPAISIEISTRCPCGTGHGGPCRRSSTPTKPLSKRDSPRTRHCRWHFVAGRRRIF